MKITIDVSPEGASALRKLRASTGWGYGTIIRSGLKAVAQRFHDVNGDHALGSEGTLNVEVLDPEDVNKQAPVVTQGQPEEVQPTAESAEVQPEPDVPPVAPEASTSQPDAPTAPEPTPEAGQEDPAPQTEPTPPPAPQ